MPAGDRSISSSGARNLRIAVTGGGSSGHVSPALAIIQAIRERLQDGGRRDVRFRYFGGKQGLERGLVEAGGIEFLGVQTGKLRRYASIKNLADAARIPLGIVQAIRGVRRFRPDVLLSTGGYAAVPAVVAAWMLRVPVIIHEQTVQIGLANRITARLASRIALSFAKAADELKPVWRRKAFVAGNPIRPVVLAGDPLWGALWAGFDPADAHLPTVYITGGSQGARIINRAIEEVLPDLLAECRIIHQCGGQPEGEEQDIEMLRRRAEGLPENLRRRYHAVRFIREEIGDVYALADLVVGRAGANTIVENCALGKPAIYIPLVPTGGDEQTRNARMCVEIGGALMIPQHELTGERLRRELFSLLADRNRLRAMGEAARTLAAPDASRVMADAVIALADGR